MYGHQSSPAAPFSRWSFALQLQHLATRLAQPQPHRQSRASVQRRGEQLINVIVQTRKFSDQALAHWALMAAIDIMDGYISQGVSRSYYYMYLGT